jgi:hypothetical protein
MPLQPTEIRINNVIKYNGELLTVHSYDFANLDWSKAEGIGLTGEILGKCGFENTGSNWYTKKYFTDCKEALELIRIDINANTFRASIENDDCEDEPAYTANPVKYLHELQNLFYCLTGEEIQVNL